MRIVTNQLGACKPTVQAAFSYYNSPYTLRRMPFTAMLKEGKREVCILNVDKITLAIHLPYIKQLIAQSLVVGILSIINQAQIVYWLSQGVHECLTYPCKPEELRLRVERLLSLRHTRPQHTREISPPLTREQLDARLFLDHRAQLLVKDNVGVYLTSKEYRVVRSLYTRRNQLLSFQQIAQLLDPRAEEPEPSPNLISSYISQIRKKAKKIQATLTIKSVYGYGYYVEAAGRADFSAT